jgi:hypothetical protein
MSRGCGFRRRRFLTAVQFPLSYRRNGLRGTAAALRDRGAVFRSEIVTGPGDNPIELFEAAG